MVLSQTYCTVDSQVNILLALEGIFQLGLKLHIDTPWWKVDPTVSTYPSQELVVMPSILKPFQKESCTVVF
jgi:hypothetical protein